MKKTHSILLSALLIIFSIQTVFAVELTVLEENDALSQPYTIENYSDPANSALANLTLESNTPSETINSDLQGSIRITSVSDSTDSLSQSNEIVQETTPIIEQPELIPPLTTHSEIESITTASHAPIDTSLPPVPPPQPLPTIIPENELSTDALAIANLVNSGTGFINWQGINTALRSPEKVKNLYSQLNYKPLWHNNGKVTSLAKQVIDAIKQAPAHALRPEVYHSELLTALAAGQTVSAPEKFDILLSDAFITYKSHLTNGIINPKSVYSTWNKPAQSIDFTSLYLWMRAQNNIGQTFIVDDADYRILQKAYQQTKQQLSNHDFVAIPAKTLKGVKQGEAVRLLRKRLGLDDSIDIYDQALRQAVKQYQRDNGLGADGIAGQRTLAFLNRSPQNHLETLMINMERYRWSYIPRGINHVAVNIPAFQMAIKQGNKKIFQSKIIVGRTKRPTPIFSDTLENVVLAPFWNVPSTIFEKDKLPKLKKNPNAFGANMQVINTATGKVVNASSVNWTNGGKGYRLRQKPGARNALGRMKFLFPNKHAIYLHDTPSRRLFKKSRRTFSSGCIRVERAEDLAVFLLNDMGYNRDRIKKESRRGNEKWVQLANNKRYPVFLDYYTAWVNDEGGISYSSDIYGYDNRLKNLYEKTLNNL